MSSLIKSSNSFIASFISKLHLGSLRRVRFITVSYCKLTIEITKLLYKEGVIRLYLLKGTKILIYYKFFRGCNLFKFKIISKPSKRVYWSLHKLSLNYNKENFSGFFVISTPIGLITSNETLILGHMSGEVLFKIYI